LLACLNSFVRTINYILLRTKGQYIGIIKWENNKHIHWRQAAELIRGEELNIEFFPRGSPPVLLVVVVVIEIPESNLVFFKTTGEVSPLKKKFRICGLFTLYKVNGSTKFVIGIASGDRAG
jgi:hypothetical protein